MSSGTNPELTAFIEHALRLIRYSFNEVGLGRLGISPSDQKMQLGQEFRQTLMDFMGAYVKGDSAKVLAHSETLRGQIALGQTLSVLTDAEADKMLDELYNLVEE